MFRSIRRSAFSMFSEERGESTSFGRGAGDELASFVVVVVVGTGFLFASCRGLASAISGRAGRFLGRTADWLALEGPSRFAILFACDTRRRFADGDGL